MKETICTIAGVVGSAIAGLFGGWDTSLVTLLLFMGIDYITVDKALFGSQGRRQYCYDSKADKGTAKKKRTA